MRTLCVVSFVLLGCAELHSELEDVGRHDDLAGIAEESLDYQEAHPHGDHGHSEPEDEQLTLDPSDLTVSTLRGCADRWLPRTTGSAPGFLSREEAVRCSGGPQAGATRLGEYIRARFPAVLNESMAHPIGIYNCRQVNGGARRSIHAEGRALDLMVPLKNGRADNARVDPLAQWLIENAEHIGIQYLIWDRSYWRGYRSPQMGCYTGSHPHNDHIHVELSWAAARMETPFFRSLEGESRPQGSDATPPVAATPPPAPRDSADPPQGGSGGWLGHPCADDDDCAHREGNPGLCVRDQGAPVDVGFCTQRCAGFCPDRQGAATTFCVPAQNVGQGGGGVCVARSHHTNRECHGWLGFEGLEMQRYLGQSGRPSATAVVCVPTRGPFGGSNPSAPQATEPDSLDPTAENVCGDDGLSMSRHGEPCPGVPANTWRCACDSNYERPVSQVCRHGSWINYMLDPGDCGRCAGRYTRGCE